MKIRITFDLSKEARIGIANYFNCDSEGNNPPADYETCKDWIQLTVGADIEALPWYKEPE